MYSDDLFDVKFNDLKNTFIINDENEVYRFIKDNETLLELLDEVKLSLNKHFNDAKYYLEVQCYPEIFRPELCVIIIINSKENVEKTNEKFLKAKLEINDFQKELGLTGKFFITMERR